VAGTSRDQRREKILEATWKLIARDGLSATSMRTLAAEAGYANGALSYYFGGKDELLRAAFEHVLGATNARIERATRGLRGLAALRAFCTEIVPDDALKLLEARVVMPFWSTAVTDRGFARLHERAMLGWRKQMRGYLSQAVASGELPTPRRRSEHAEVAELLLTIMSGMQVLAVLTPKQHTPLVMAKMIDDCLQQLSVQRRAEARSGELPLRRGKGKTAR